MLELVCLKSKIKTKSLPSYNIISRRVKMNLLLVKMTVIGDQNNMNIFEKRGGGGQKGIFPKQYSHLIFFPKFFKI